ncbi:hypothetical protein J2D73_18580 [Acetobacter sacchari]|uniref:Uncharacterized protein n=1 Tax=Acetobacter sacchari TaxID=2661687 RepID=A0ABS3M0S4_9PROT|nr:hypothetical protein [Acetobacter sacchari]MBO1361792.1 hypothetical protein [Acetobacter sacchari]
MTRRIIINRAVDNGPTPERVAKGDLESAQGGVQTRRRWRGLNSLLKSGEIESQHVNAAERWYRDYVLSTVGHFESKLDEDLFLADEAAWSAHDEKLARIAAEREAGYSHDAISWGIMRGRAGCRVGVVRDKIRKPGENLLVFLLADNVTFCDAARTLLPKVSHSYNGARLVKAMCVLVLTQLEDIYSPANRSAFDVCYLNRDTVLKRAEERCVERV